MFDGNAGWQLADRLSKKLHTAIEANLKSNGGATDSQVKEAICKAFDQMESEWYEVAKATFDKGFSKPAYVSSTALVVLIRDNKVYIANSGDSKAVLVRKAGKTFE